MAALEMPEMTWNGDEYWYTLVSEFKLILIPYTACEATFWSIVQLYVPRVPFTLPEKNS